jgi:hypothetical protein
LLLEELLCPIQSISNCDANLFAEYEYSQVLKISSGELRVRNDLDLSVSLLRDLHSIAEVSNTSINLNLVLEELLEGGDVEDLVAGGLRSVDDELFPLVN